MKFFFILVAATLVAYALGLAATVGVNPEVRFWREVQLRRQHEMESVRKATQGKPSILFAGGSSTAFSVDPAIIEEASGLSAFNLALPAAAGPRYLLDHPLRQANAGDILVIGLEADFLCDESDYPAGMFSFGLALREGSPRATVGGETFGGGVNLRDAMTFSRPGPRYLLTLVARGMTGKGYRYTSQDYRYHGRIETAVEDPGMLPNDVERDRRLSRAGGKLLATLRDAASTRGVRLCYAMPWRFTSVQGEGVARASNAALLLEIARILPVIRDGADGVAIERGYFSDSHQHLTATGSVARSRALAEGLGKFLAAH